VSADVLGLTAQIVFVKRHQELDSFDVENWTVMSNRLAARVCAASLE
jgi:hypothetical protein